MLKLPDKPNILSPTLREKHRYVAYKVIAEDKFEFNDLVNSMWHSVLNLLGELGCAKMNLWVIRNTFNEKDKTGLIRCDHRQVERLRAALALVQGAGETRIIIQVLGVSGTIKAAKKKFFEEVDLKTFTE